MLRHANPRITTIVVAAVALLCATAVWAVDNGGNVQGVVKGASGDPVAGAFVKLNNAERRLTFMVISQAQGRYTAKNLPPGQWVVQGVGGDKQSEKSAPVEVSAGGNATVDVSLTVQRAPALPAAWPGRPPGEEGGESASGGGVPVKLPPGPGQVIANTKCSLCHDAERIATAGYDREQWKNTIEDMRAYMQGSNQAKDLTDQEEKVLLDYVADNFAPKTKAQGGKGKPDPNSRLPWTLQTGDTMKYVSVEFTLPNPKAEPHEVAVDSEGNGWVTQRTGGRLGRLDVKTLAYKEIDPPKAGAKNRLNGIVSTANNKFWFLDGGPNRRWLNYDTKTGEFNVYALPKLKSGAASGNTMRVHPNGTIWLNSIAANEVIRLDPNTHEFTVYEVPSGVKAGKTANPYGMAISGDGKVWFVENAMNKLGRIDPVTGHIDEYDVPVKNATPRKAGMDSEGNPWFGLHGAGKLMKVDYKTLKMTVYTPPSENAGVYSVQGDPKSKLVWFSEQQVDKIGRFDPQTETFTEFPLPNAESDHRRIDIDPNHPNRIWWSGDTSGRMGYIELLDGSAM